MPLATKNNAIILKDGKLAENCGCCVSCPDYRVLMQAQTLLLDFEWSFSSVQTLYQGYSVNWNYTRYLPRQTYSLSRYAYQDVYAPREYSASWSTGRVDTLPLPADLLSQRKELNVSMVSYQVPMYDELNSYRPTRGGSLQFSLNTFEQYYQILRFTETPCHSSSNTEPCRRSLRYQLYDIGAARNNRAAQVTTAVNNGQQVFSLNWTPTNFWEIRSMDFNLFDNSVPASVQCSSSSGYIPEAGAGATSFTSVSTEDPVTGLYGNNTVITESFTIHSARAVIGGQEYNILGASQSPDWAFGTAAYQGLGASPWIPIQT